MGFGLLLLITLFMMGGDEATPPHTSFMRASDGTWWWGTVGGDMYGPFVSEANARDGRDAVWSGRHRDTNYYIGRYDIAGEMMDETGKENLTWWVWHPGTGMANSGDLHGPFSTQKRASDFAIEHWSEVEHV